MIIGVGIDLVEVARLTEVIDRTGARFLDRVFTRREQELCAGRPWRLAGRFAAKEALLKSIGTGLRGFSWQQIEILADELGAPQPVCHGQFARALAEAGANRIHLSITHSSDYAMAQAILEGVDS